jgi:hypothetical protein
VLRRTALASAVTVAMLGVSGGVTARAIGLIDVGSTPAAVVPSTTTVATAVATTVQPGRGAATTPAPVVVSREEIVDVYVVVTVPGALPAPVDGAGAPAPGAPPTPAPPAGAAPAGTPTADPSTAGPTAPPPSPTTTRYVPELDPGYEPPSDELPNPVG